MDFAGAQVWADLSWTEDTITVRILDDGPGFPPHLLGRMGDPFLRRGTRLPSSSTRPEYEGMGLGLFIAKTLLERTGATLRFTNGPEDVPHSGAVVEVTWARDALEADRVDMENPLGENQPIAV